MFQHEIYFFGSYLLSCNNQVAFVFAVRVIGDDDDMAGLQFFQCFFDGVEFTFFCSQNKDLLKVCLSVL